LRLEQPASTDAASTTGTTDNLARTTMQLS
jgi:hypothetical protein